MLEQNASVFHKDRISWLPEPYIETIDSVMDIVITMDDIVKVILFGSCSRGSLNEQSDIDLLFLLHNKEIPFPQLEQNIGTMIYEKYDSNFKKPVDFLFADLDVFDNSTNPYSVFRFIKKEGLTIYE